MLLDFDLSLLTWHFLFRLDWTLDLTYPDKTVSLTPTCLKWFETWPKLVLIDYFLRLDLNLSQLTLTWDLTQTCLNWLDTWLGVIIIMMNCCNWLASSPPASEAALWALQHRVQLWPDVGPGRRLADRPFSLHLADEQRAHTGLRAWRGPANHAESRLAHQRPPAAAEAPVLFRPGQRHRLRCVGSATKHEEGWEGHRVQYAATGGWELPSRTHLRHHRGQDELLRHGLQEGDGKRQVSQTTVLYLFVPVFGTTSLHFTAHLQFFSLTNLPLSTLTFTVLFAAMISTLSMLMVCSMRCAFLVLNPPFHEALSKWIT